VDFRGNHFLSKKSGIYWKELDMKSRWFTAWLAGIVILASQTGASAAQGWMTSYSQALAISTKTGKPILTNFTGSDWCGWCIKLKQEVFSTAEFKKWATENVVLLELDYPQRTPQPAAIKKQNQALAKKYAIRGYPTILFLDGTGKVVGKSGYMRGGPAAWTKHAQGVVDSNKPPTLALHKNLAAALKDANENNKSLFVAVSQAGNKYHQKAITTLFSDQGFISMANSRLSVVQVKTGPAGVGAGPSAKLVANADTASLKQLRVKYKVPTAAFQFVAIDLKNDKLLLNVTKPTDGKTMTAKLAKALPKPTYGGEWIEDFAKAQGLATALGRPMVLNFTGSDWCGWCIKLKGEVFTKDEFKKYAAENLVLVKLDFPQRTPQSQELKTQNRQLQQKFGVRGFPTLVITDSSGAAIGKMGYQPGGPGPFIAKLKQVTGK
jgi:protein disulfide-isomerase